MRQPKWAAPILSLLKPCAALYWCVLLITSEADFSLTPYVLPYLAVCAAGFYCWGRNRKAPSVPAKGLDRFLTLALPFLLTCAVVLANYKVYLPAYDRLLTKLECGVSLLLSAIGAFFLFHQIALTVFAQVRGQPRWTGFASDRKWIFWGSFVCLAGLYFLNFWAVLYPGVMTVDSVDQLRQILAGEYSNHHPYWHTQIIRLAVQLGLALFGNLTDAVAIYSVFSLLCMAAVFSGVVDTVYRLSGRRRFAALAFVYYFAMPYHILYSVTMWKDVFFGAAVTLFAMGVLRTLLGIGRHPRGNLVLTLCAALGMCLLRSNGLIAYLAALVVFLLLFWKERKRLAVLLAAVAVAGICLTGPVLTLLNVAPVNIVESLSIPLQQIGRTVYDGRALTQEQQTLLDAVMDTEAISNVYTPWISDPMKNLVSQKKNWSALTEPDYGKLYFSLGLRYPGEYLSAWVDQTQGYWNGGYQFWVRAYGITENDWGLEVLPRSDTLRQLFISYSESFLTQPMLQLFMSIGFFVWMLLYCAYAACIRRDKAALFLCVPILCVLLTLLIATPVAAEHRYAYSLFCTIPLALTACLGSSRK